MTAENDDELQKILSELRSELRGHLDDVRARAVEVRAKIFRAAEETEAECTFRRQMASQNLFE